MSGNPNPPPPPVGPTPGGHPPGDDWCAGLSFEAQLASPVPNVITGLAVDEELSIEIKDRAGIRVIAAITAAGDIAGSIVDRVQELLRCLQDGHRFRARVVAISGGAVTLCIETST